MSSSYTGNPANATQTLTLIDDGDTPTAQTHRVPLERLLDNDSVHFEQNLRSNVLRLRTFQQFGDTLDALDAGAGVPVFALQFNRSTLALLANTNGVLLVGALDRYRLLGAFAEIFLPISTFFPLQIVAAHNGSRIVAVGEGATGPGPASDYSDDGGATWNLGAVLGGGAQADWLLYDATHTKFMLAVAGEVYFSSNGVAAWTSTSAGLAANKRTGCLSNGRQIGIKAGAGALVFRTSTNGTSWADAGGTVANAASMTTATSKGQVAGTVGDLIYHVGVLAGGELQVSSTADGTVWTVLATIDPTDHGLINFGTAAPVIMQCPDTGLLVIGATANTSTLSAILASRDGETWVRAEIITETPATYAIRHLSVADGRVFCLIDDQLMASDGVGE